MLSASVTDRFTRISGMTVVVALLDVPGTQNQPFVTSLPPHPECADHFGSDACREICQSHLDELKHRLASHWHRCPFDYACAVIPVVWHDRCLAALRLVCPGPVSDNTFEGNAELLEILVENFLVAETEFLARWTQIPAVLHVGDPDKSGGDGDDSFKTGVLHPQVIKALEHIEQHLTDPTLTVAATAQTLNINASYLAHLFVQQTGRRMSRHISDGRIKLAKKLLATTNWQIKRIAFKSGHANADWFSHVFHAHVGLTPGDYRRKVRNADRR